MNDVNTAEFREMILNATGKQISNVTPVFLSGYEFVTATNSLSNCAYFGRWHYYSRSPELNVAGQFLAVNKLIVFALQGKIVWVMDMNSAISFVANPGFNILFDEIYFSAGSSWLNPSTNVVAGALTFSAVLNYDFEIENQDNADLLFKLNGFLSEINSGEVANMNGEYISFEAMVPENEMLVIQTPGYQFCSWLSPGQKLVSAFTDSTHRQVAVACPGTLSHVTFMTIGAGWTLSSVGLITADNVLALTLRHYWHMGNAYRITTPETNGRILIEWLAGVGTHTRVASLILFQPNTDWWYPVHPDLVTIFNMQIRWFSNAATAAQAIEFRNTEPLHYIGIEDMAGGAGASFVVLAGQSFFREVAFPFVIKMHSYPDPVKVVLEMWSGTTMLDSAEMEPYQTLTITTPIESLSGIPIESFRFRLEY